MRWIVLMMCFFFLTAAGLQSSKTSRAMLTSKPKNIGGQETKIEKYPFAVQLYKDRSGIKVYSCSGVLVTTWHVLTAAHCLAKWEFFEDKYPDNAHPKPFQMMLKVSVASDVFARFGTSSLNTGGSLHQGSAIIIHPNFDIFPTHDIALILLATAVSTSNMVRVAILPPSGQPVPDDTRVKVVGWGTAFDTYVIPTSVLHEAIIRTINIRECTKRLNEPHNHGGTFIMEDYKSNYFCAGLFDVGGEGTCFGDSGGPVVLEGVVIGIASGGSGHDIKCADPYYPSVFTKLSSYTDWISETVSGTTSDSTHIGQSSLITLSVIALIIIFS